MNRRIRGACFFALLAWIECFAPPALAVTDEELLRGLHEKVMRAHRQNDVEVLLEDEASDSVMGTRGEVIRPALEERRAHIGSYLRSTTFEEYRDAIEPVVAVSKDGTLGWVIVQVQARGIREIEGKKEPLSFVSAWIELYEKRKGRWYRVGNVSNFKP